MTFCPTTPFGKATGRVLAPADGSVTPPEPSPADAATCPVSDGAAGFPLLPHPTEIERQTIATAARACLWHFLD